MDSTAYYQNIITQLGRQEVLKKDEYVDSIIMSILKSEWKESNI
jgi:RimJ/RimL family protein N-acetyltransferase